MNLDRKFIYALVLIWYYTLVMLYSLQLGYIDVIFAVLAITAFSYIWLVEVATKSLKTNIIDYKDLVITIFIYCFVSFYIVFMTLVFSPQSSDTLKIFLMILPIVVWIGIWTDHYLNKMAVSGYG